MAVALGRQAGATEVAHAQSLPPPTTEIVGAIIVNVRLQALVTDG